MSHAPCSAESATLLRLANEFEAGTIKAGASGYEEFGPEWQRERALIISSLRFCAHIGAPAQAESEPAAYWVEHPKFGMELSLDPPNEDAVKRGWVATPLYAALPQAESIKDIREKAEEAIRTFCYSLGAATVKTSSDGMDRIYYSGISLDALAAAVAMALTRPQSDGK